MDESIKTCKCFEKMKHQQLMQTQCFHEVVKSEARKKYEMMYLDEVELNLRFNKFVQNIKYAYEGNTSTKSYGSKLLCTLPL